uniref:Uncharacterized protein n=1 Tax=Fagus sylvatica TaxID=28930 RepID=A0A2N9EPR2_FAGSY
MNEVHVEPNESVVANEEFSEEEASGEDMDEAHESEGVDVANDEFREEHNEDNLGDGGVNEEASDASEVKVEEFFLGFIKVDNMSGLGLFKRFENTLMDLKLNIDDIRGQSYDNGSNMKGKHQDKVDWVSQVLQKEEINLENAIIKIKELILFFEKLREDGFLDLIEEGRELARKVAQISWLNSAWLVSRLDGSDLGSEARWLGFWLEVDLGLAWSDHGSMAQIVTQWLRGSDLEMVLARDLNSVARWLGSISAHLR